MLDLDPDLDAAENIPVKSQEQQCTEDMVSSTLASFPPMPRTAKERAAAIREGLLKYERSSRLFRTLVQAGADVPGQLTDGKIAKIQQELDVSMEDIHREIRRIENNFPPRGPSLPRQYNSGSKSRPQASTAFMGTNNEDLSEIVSTSNNTRQPGNAV